MAETLNDTALITPEDLARDALDSLGLDLSKDGAGDPVDQAAYDAAIAAIEDATSYISAHVERNLIVSHVFQAAEMSDWQFNAATDTWTAYADEWPVVDVVTTGVSSLDIDDELLEIDAPENTVVEYFAGYHRPDQDLAALQTLFPLLGTLPPLVPGGIRRVATELALHQLFAAENKQLGTGRTSQNIGGQVVTVERIETGFHERVLSSIDRHRRMAL